MNKSMKVMTSSKFSRALSTASGYGLICATAAGLVTSGCDGGDAPVRGERIAVTPAGAEATVTDNVRTMMDLMWRVERFVDTAKTLDTLGNVLGGNDEDEPSEGEDDEVGFLLPVDAASFDDFQSNLRDNLLSSVLREDQIESRTDTSIVYRIDPAEFCGDEEEGADCRTALTALDVRVAVSSVSDGDINLQVLLGADRAELALFEAHADSLAATVNAKPLVDAFITAEHAINPDGATTVATQARGSVRLALRKLSATTLRATVDVTSPILIDATNPDGPVTIAADIGGVSIEVNLLDETGELEVDLREVAITGAKRLLFDEEGCLEEGQEDCTPPAGTVSVQVDRLAGIVGLADREDMLSVTGLLVGGIGLAMDNRDVLALGLDDGRTPIDLTLTAEDNVIDLAMTGAATFDLITAFHVAADLWSDFAESWVWDDHLSVAIPNTATAVHLDNGVLSLTEGSLALASEARPDLDRSIEVGQCIAHIEYDDTEEGTENDDAHPFALEVVTCSGSSN